MRQNPRLVMRVSPVRMMAFRLGFFSVRCHLRCTFVECITARMYSFDAFALSVAAVFDKNVACLFG